MLKSDKLILIQEIEKSDKKLTDWEFNFLKSIEQVDNLSIKQAKCLEKIYAKCFNGGKYIEKEF